jgi:flagellar hook-basal body complex protein FliE
MTIDSYGTAIGKIVPGTFVPDVGAQAAPALPQPLSVDEAPDAVAGTSFRDTVKSLLNDVNDKMVGAEQQSQDYALGKTNDLEGTVKKLEQASLAFQMTMSVRNKITQAYSEIQQMQF